MSDNESRTDHETLVYQQPRPYKFNAYHGPLKHPQQTIEDPNALPSIVRPRLNRLFAAAAQYPLVVVCAGAGYGKTCAVKDFARETHLMTAWVQLSERDNDISHFWNNYTYAMGQINPSFTQVFNDLGFPDSEEKLVKYYAAGYKLVADTRYILVFDDFHLIESPDIISFVENRIIQMVEGVSVFLISRTMTNINITGMASRGYLVPIDENDLQFTDDELSLFFKHLGISLQSHNLREILQDTSGWVFAINLIARSYRNAPEYRGYLRDAMRMTVFRLIETEVFSRLSQRLQDFLIRLSLLDHHSAELISLLSNRDDELIAELNHQSAYARLDESTNAYLMHPLFLEFLREKQSFLSKSLKRETFKIAADWCNKNGFKIDALSYYEKVGDYESIVSIFFELPTKLPPDIARFAEDMFERAPEAAFNEVDFLAAMHVRSVICLGHLREALALMQHYEAKYLKYPADSDFRNHTLGGIYYAWGNMNALMCAFDDCHDFVECYAKMDECFSQASSSFDTGSLSSHPIGPWVSLTSSAEKGAPGAFAESIAQSEVYTSHCLNGAMTGIGDLAKGELLFYQGNLQAAEASLMSALVRAREKQQFEIVHKALEYLLRIAAFHGDFGSMELALKDMEAQLNEERYFDRFITYDVSLAWYYCFLNMPERTPDWLKGRFIPYSHPYYIENSCNRARAMYSYTTKNFPLVLTYIQEQRQRETILLGRVESLAMESCIHFKTKNKEEAFAVLKEAYETALPNEIFMPFVELGKDMRTLATAALKETNSKSYKTWLENIKSKASSYAKRQSHIITQYRQAYHLDDEISLSPREKEILTDLSHGLSRTEIAASRNLSINSVKQLISTVYSKLGAENLADLIRIAAARGLI